MEGIKAKEGSRGSMENVRRISIIGGGHRRTKSGVSNSHIAGGGELVAGGDVPAVTPLVKHKPNNSTLDLHATANGNGHLDHHEQLLPPIELRPLSPPSSTPTNGNGMGRRRRASSGSGRTRKRLRVWPGCPPRWGCLLCLPPPQFQDPLLVRVWFWVRLGLGCRC